LIVTGSQCGIFNTSVNVYINDKYTELSTLYTVPYSNNSNYYISGPTSIIYNNLGTLDYNSMSTDAYCLFKKDTNEIEPAYWFIKYYIKDTDKFRELVNTDT
jgi:hypothetical protein